MPARYCGPPNSGNGGYTAGALAAHLGGDLGSAITVSLRQPPPLDATMQVNGDDDQRTLTFGGAVIAEASLAAQAPEPQPHRLVSYDEATAASASFPGHTFHPFATCFSCGVDREDGLRIFPGLVSTPGEPVTLAAPWTPDGSVLADFHELDDSARRACLASTWAALDCIGGWAGDFGKRLMVLARMTAVVDELPVVGEPHVVLGHALRTEGRKTFTASTLLDSDGRIVGRAEHLWIAVDPERFGGAAG